MHKVVYNRCFGGFSLSNEALMLLYEKKGKEIFPYKEDINSGTYKLLDKVGKDQFWTHFSTKYLGEETDGIPDECYVSFYDISRHDKELVEVVEELGERANGSCADLAIDEISSDMYYIDEYDGSESVITPETDHDWIVIEDK